MIKYIIDILKNEDNIFINDLGLFEKKMVSAQMNVKTILPPHNKILFDADGEGNGFAFILKYAEKNQKRLNDADTDIRKWVAELKTGIQNNKSVDIDGFGVFTLNNKGVIAFESAFIKELNLDFEGMEPVNVQPVKPEIKIEPEPVEENIPAPVVEEVEPIISVEEVEITPIVEEQPEEIVVQEEPPIKIETAEEEEKEEEENTDKKGIQNRNIFVRILLFILLILLFPAAFFVYMYRVPLELTFKEYQYKLFHQKSDTPALNDAQSFNFFDGFTLKNSAEITVPYAMGYNAEEVAIVVEEPVVVEPVVEKPTPKPTEVTQPVQTEKPVQTGKPVEITTPLQIIKPVEKPKPVETPKPVEKPKPVETVKAVEIARPAESTKPAEKTKPVETVKPVETPKPIEKTQPSNSELFYHDYQAGKYYVIAGSFTQESEAVNHIKQRNLQKYNPFIVKQVGNSRLRICIGVFDSKDEAVAFATSQNKEFWVL